MDYNKDEASRAKEIAERKLLVQKDIKGAKWFALKAQSLFPTLEGISHFIEIIDVYLAYEKKINGEPDYYGVLGVNPFVDEESLKKQYRKMALMLHPDKNRSAGANEAFKILSEAWRVLSNYDTRNDYNMKLNLRPPWNQSSNVTSTRARPSAAPSPQYAPTQIWAPGAATSQYNASVPPHLRGANKQWTPEASAFGGSDSMHTNFQAQPPTSMGVKLVPTSGNPSCLAPNTRKQSRPSKRSRKAPASAATAEHIPSPRPSVQQKSVPGPSQVRRKPVRAESFWTLCSSCGIYYEYHTMYLKKTLLCRRCEQPFLAIAIAAPKRKTKRSQHTSTFRRQKRDMPAASSVAGNMPSLSTE